MPLMLLLDILRRRIKYIENEYSQAKSRGLVRSSSMECFEWASGRRLMAWGDLQEVIAIFDGHLKPVLSFIKAELDRSAELGRLEPVLGIDDDQTLAVFLLLKTN